MSNERTADVLIVGAGPVGLLLGLLLAETGVKVKIIDKEEGTAARSYGCALHPSSLKILDRVGLAKDLIAAGHRIDTLAFYQGRARRAELRLSTLATDFPFLVVLPQSRLEELLEERLRSKHGVEVSWNHRLADLHQSGDAAALTVHKLGYACTGYLVSELERLVVKKLRFDVALVAGADGHGSLVRQSLEIPFESVAGPEIYAVREVALGGTIEPEMRVVLDDASISVCWPFAENRCRWSCQLAEAGPGSDHPKERQAVLLEEEALDRSSIGHLQEFIRQRAPWFDTPIKEIDWSATVQFERRLAGRFGQGRCWLAGDAAHQTGPVGVHSLNGGLSEAADLAGRFAAILRGQAGLGTLEDYHRERHDQWWRLLKSSPTANAQTDPWIRQNASRIWACLPAEGPDLTALAGQLGLAFA